MIDCKNSEKKYVFIIRKYAKINEKKQNHCKICTEPKSIDQSIIKRKKKSRNKISCKSETGSDL